jgi:hypothetical protein
VSTCEGGIEEEVGLLIESIERANIYPPVT